MIPAATPPPWVAHRDTVRGGGRLLKAVVPEVYAALGDAEWDELPRLLSESLDTQLRRMTLDAPARRALVGAQQRAAWARLALAGGHVHPAQPLGSRIRNSNTSTSTSTSSREGGRAAPCSCVSADLVDAIGECCRDAAPHIAERECGFTRPAWLYAHLRQQERFSAHAHPALATRLMTGRSACALEHELLDELERAASTFGPMIRNPSATRKLRCMRRMVVDVENSRRRASKYDKYRACDPQAPAPAKHVSLDVKVLDKGAWPTRVWRPDRSKHIRRPIPAVVGGGGEVSECLPADLLACMECYARFFAAKEAKAGRRVVPGSAPPRRLPSVVLEGRSQPGAQSTYMLKRASLVMLKSRTAAQEAVEGSETVTTEWLTHLCQVDVHPHCAPSAPKAFQRFVVEMKLPMYTVLQLFNSHAVLWASKISELTGLPHQHCDLILRSLSCGQHEVLRPCGNAGTDSGVDSGIGIGVSETHFEPNPQFVGACIQPDSADARPRKRVKIGWLREPLAKPPPVQPPLLGAATGGGSRSQPQVPMDKRSFTGFCGLSNQGATCYLNSLLQSLYMSPEFKRGLYSWVYSPEHDGAMDECVPFQLQKLFVLMDVSESRAVSTTALTRSFGWTHGQAFVQHDVQELCRVLFDALEEALTGTDQANLISRLYGGQMQDYVQCVECKHQSTRNDEFLDIHLTIRNFGSTEPIHSIEQGLSNYFAPETLEGDNMWSCGRCQQKRAALKGLRLTKLPYLLTLQLKRFDFDYQTNARIKLADRVTFPTTLDMGPFVYVDPADDGAPSTPPEIAYQLFAVLVHAGNARFGHYYAYILDFTTSRWLEFNDASVTPLAAPGLEQAFGSVTSSTAGSAYMLMYRRLDAEANMAPVRWRLEDIPPLIKIDLEKDRSRANQAVQEKLQQFNQTEVRVYWKDGQPVSLAVLRTQQVGEVAIAAWTALKSTSDSDVPQLRMRTYDERFDVPGALCEETANVHFQSAFQLETCAADELWTDNVYGDDGASGSAGRVFFRMCSFKRDSASLRPDQCPVVKQFGERATITDIRQAFFEALGIPVEQQGRVHVFNNSSGQKSQLGEVIVHSPDLRLSDLKLYAGSLLFVEEVEYAANPLLMLGDPITIHVKAMGGTVTTLSVGAINTVGDIKALYEQAKGKPVNCQRLVLKGQELQDTSIVEHVSIVDGSLLFVVFRPPCSMPVYETALTMAHTARIRFGDIDGDRIYHEMRFDVRRPLSEFKQELALRVGCDAAKFNIHCQGQGVLWRMATSVADQTYSYLCLALSLKSSPAAARPGIHRCHIYFHIPGKSPQFLLHDEGVEESFNVLEYKQRLLPKLQALASTKIAAGSDSTDDDSLWSLLTSATAEHLRLREPGYAVFRDSASLVEELGAFSQNQRLAVQLLTEREPKVKHAQAVVAVYVWKPDEFCLDDSPSETVVDTSWSVARFRIELGKICWKDTLPTLGSSDTAELLPHMSVAQRSTSADFSVAPSPLDMEKLVWDQDQATDQVVAPTLEGSPFVVKDGAVFFCFDKRTPARVLMPDERTRLEQLQAKEEAATREAEAAQRAKDESGQRASEQQLQIRRHKRQEQPAPVPVPMSTGCTDMAIDDE